MTPTSRQYKRSRYAGITILMCLVFALTAAQAAHFQAPAPSPYACDFLGSVKIDGVPAEAGDEVAFYDPQGNLCGRFTVNTNGAYGVLHVYGDDPSTAAVDEGAVYGDVLRVRLFDSSEGKEISGGDLQFSAGQPPQGSSFLPAAVPPVWEDQKGFVLHIATRSHFTAPAGSPFACGFIGDLTVLGQPAQIGDEIAVFDGGGDLCGHSRVVEPGRYGIVYVYGDDPTTTDVQEGPADGDPLTFEVYDKSTGVERTAELSAGAEQGAFAASPVPPVYTEDAFYVLNAAAQYEYQSVSLMPADITQNAGTQLALTAAYDVSDQNSQLQAVGVRFHFDAAKMDFQGFSDLFSAGSAVIEDAPQADTQDFDANPDTDRYVSITWSGTAWPAQDLPLNLCTLQFDINDRAEPGTSRVNVTFMTTAPGYEGSPAHTVITITNPAATVQGQIDYAGAAQGIYYVAAWPSDVGADFWQTPPAAVAAGSSGGYVLRVLAGDYFLAAYRDTDGGGSLVTVDVDPDEPRGHYASTTGPAAQNDEPTVVNIASGQTITRDFTIYDRPFIISAALARNTFPEGFPSAFPSGEVLRADVNADYRPGIANISSVHLSGPGVAVEAQLHDNGLLPDEVAGDGWFSGWVDTGGTVTEGPFHLKVSANSLIDEQSRGLSGAALSTVTVTAPDIWSTTLEPDFTWDPVDGAGGGYTLHILATDDPETAGDFLLVKRDISGETYHLLPQDLELDNGATYYYIIEAADAAGQNRGYSPFLSFTVDTTFPTVASVAFDPPSPVKAETVNLTIAFSEAMDDSIPLTAAFDADEKTFNGDFTAADTWVGTYTVEAGGDGRKRLYIRNAADPAGNPMTEDSTHTFMIDTAAPGLIGILLSPDSPVHAEQVTFTLNFSETMNQSIAPLVQFADPVRTVSGNFTNAYTWVGKHTIPIGLDGRDIGIRVENAADPAGNVMTPDESRTFDIDTQPPLPPVIDPVQSPTFNNTQRVSGTKEADAAVLLDGLEVVGHTPAEEWQYTVSLAGGDNHLVFAAKDRARNLSGQSTVDIVFDDNPPPKVEVLQLDSNLDGTRIALDWQTYNEAAVGDIAYYRIYSYFQDFGSDVQGLPIAATVDAGHFNYTVSGLEKGKSYYFAVVPVDTRGNADTTVISVSAAPVDVQPPDDVSGIGIACLGADTLQLTWTPSADTWSDLTSQRVYFNDETTFSTVAKETYSFQKSGLNAGTAYNFRITTVDADGNESAGSSVTAVTLLDNPSGLDVQAGDTYIDLTWDPVVAALLESYRVYRQAASFDSVAGLTPVQTVGSQNSARIGGLSNDTTYHFAVAAVNASGCENTAVVSAVGTPREDIEPPVISNLTVNGRVLENGLLIEKAAVFRLELSDNKPLADATASARVEFRLNNALAHTDAYDGDAVFQFVWDTIAADDGRYTLAVKAFDRLGNPAVRSFQLTLQLAPPAAPVITDVKITATDNAVASNGIISDAGITVSGTADLGTQIQLFNNDLPAGTLSAVDAGGRFSIAIDLHEGENRITASAQHRGGASLRSNLYGVNLDTGAPSAPRNLDARSQDNGIVEFDWLAPETGETPAGYNLYQSAQPVTTAGDAQKVNTSPITRLNFSNLFPVDGTFYFAVTAVDAANNESGLSEWIRAVVDSVPPEITDVTFTPGGRYLNGVYGVGIVDVTVQVSEALLTDPFVSMAVTGAAPLAVGLTRDAVDPTLYRGDFQIADATPSGTATLIFSGRDLVGNRGTAVSADPKSIQIDTAGPRLIDIAVTPPEPIENNPVAPLTVHAVLTLDQPVQNHDAAYLSLAYTTVEHPAPVDIVSLTRDENDDTVWYAEFSLDATDGASAQNFIQFSFEAVDDLENSSRVITGQNRFELYQGGLPPLSAPTGMNAAALPGGEVALSWNVVSEAAEYQVYRQAPGEDTFSAFLRVQETSLVDPTDTDGLYTYAVASVRKVGEVESLSAMSASVSVFSDRLPPGVPQNVSLTMLGSGVMAQWTAPAGETPFAYQLYRADQERDTVAGLTPVKQNIGGLWTTDPSPSAAQRYYTVTAVDETGNVSAPGNWAYQNVDLLPVNTFHILQIDRQAPSLSWTHPAGSTIIGYDLLLETPAGDIRIFETQDVTHYTDTGYDAREKTYKVQAVDDQDLRSTARSAFLPVLRMHLPADEVIYRGIVNRLTVRVENAGPSTVVVNRLEILLNGRTYSSETFTLDGGSLQNVDVVVGGGSDFEAIEPITMTLVMSPEQGTEVKIRESGEVPVQEEILPLEVFNETLVRGSTAKIRFTLHNTAAEPMEIITAAGSGATASPEIRVNILDEDDNLINQTRLRQTQGDFVQLSTTGRYIATIPPGASFTSDEVLVDLPLSAPENVVIAVEIDAGHYHYGWPDHIQVNGPGGGTWRKTFQDVTLIDTVYDARIDTVEPQNAVVGQTIHIHGIAIDRDSEDPENPVTVANVPVKIGISVNRFERYFEVFTDNAGGFVCEFDPLSSEYGTYRAWAVHPIVTDKPVQATFTLSSLDYSPRLFDLNITKNNTDVFPVSFRNEGGTDLHNLALVYRAEDQPAGVLDPELVVELDPAKTLAAGESTQLHFRIKGSAAAAYDGEIVLSVVSDETSDASWGTVRAAYAFFDPKPSIYYHPGDIKVTLYPGDTDLDSFTLENTGLVALENMHLSMAPPAPSPGIDWILLNTQQNPGGLNVGQKMSVPISFSPPQNTEPGIYETILSIESDNAPTASLHVFARIVSRPEVGEPEPGGNALFHVVDYNYDGVSNLGLPGANITLQSTDDINLTFKAATAESGHADLGVGEAMFENIPEGRYNFKVTRSGHNDFTGSIRVKPNATVSEQVYLTTELVQVEWSVTEITIEDRYEIKLTATFETNVPAPVVTMEPMSVNLPDMNTGEVLTGEFRITNHGLIRAKNLDVEMPEDDEYFSYELIGAVPDYLEAKQQIVLPYRVTCLAKIGEAEAAEGGGGSGGGCGLHAKYVCVGYTYNPCPGIPALAVNGKICGWYIYGIPCPSKPTKPKIYLPPPPRTTTVKKTYTTSGGHSSGGWTGGGFGGWGSLGGSSSPSKMKGFRCPPKCKPGEPCNFCCQLFNNPDIMDGCGGGDDGGNPLEDIARACAGDGPLGDALDAYDSAKSLQKTVNTVSQLFSGKCGGGGNASDGGGPVPTASFVNPVSGHYSDFVVDMAARYGRLTAWVARTFSGTGPWRFEYFDDRLTKGQRPIYYSGGAVSISGNRPLYYDELNRVVDENWTLMKGDIAYACGGTLPADDTVPDGAKGRNYIFQNGAYTLRTLGGYYDENEGADDLFAFGKYFHFNGFLWKAPQGKWKKYDDRGRLIAFGYGDPGSVPGIRLEWDADADQLLRVFRPDDTAVFEFVYANGAVRPTGARQLDADGTPTATTLYEWSGDNLEKVTDVTGNEWTFTYDAKKRITHKSEPGGRRYTFAYDNYDSVEVQKFFSISGDTPVETLFHQIEFAYEFDETRQEYRTIVTEPGKAEVELIYDGNGSLVEKRIQGDLAVRITEDLDKREKRVRDAAGNLKVEKFTEFGAIQSVAFADGSTWRARYASNYRRPLETINRAGTSVQMAYDSDGRISRVTEAAGTPYARQTTYEYTDGRRTAVHAPGGAVTEKAHDANGRITELTEPESRVTAFEYDEGGEVTKITDPMNRTVAYGYDAAGRQIQVTEPVAPEESITTRMEYDPFGNRTRLLYPGGEGLAFFYDMKNRLTGIALIHASGDIGASTRSYTYSIDEETGETTTRIIDAEGEARADVYDIYGRLVSTEDPAGNTTTYEYSSYDITGCRTCGAAGGRPKRVLQPGFAGGTVETVLQYDWEGYLTAKTRSAGDASLSTTEQWEYDVTGNITAYTDGNAYTTLRTYDPFGNVVRVDNALLGIVKLTYDDRDNLTQFTDEAGKSTDLTYDSADRLTGWTSPLGKGTRFDYDANDNLIAETTARNKIIEYAYDWKNRMTGYSADGGTVTFDYTAFDQLAGYADAVVSAERSYDDAHRMTDESVTLAPPDAAAVDYATITAYNPDGTVAAFTDPSGERYTYAYDDANRTTEIILPDSAGTVSYTYAWDRISSVTYPGGAVNTRTYDGLWRLSANAVQDGGGSVLLNQSYAWDAENNLTGLTIDGEAQNRRYIYDKLYRLTRADEKGVQTTFQYDAVGNRRSIDEGDAWTYNDWHQLTGIGDTDTFRYDDDGNLVQSSRSAAVRHYVFDSFNRLVEIRDAQDAVIAKYAYDPFGRRIVKKTGGNVHVYAYSDQGIIAKWTNGALNRTYVYRPDSRWGDAPVFMRTWPGGAYYFFHTDHLDRPWLLTDAGGGIAWQADYSAFGQATLITTLVENPLRFPGQYYDTETGLHYNLNRYYDPSLGRYISADPIGPDIGSSSLYVYAGNNPLSDTDPEGLIRGSTTIGDVEEGGPLDDLLPSTDDGVELMKRICSGENPVKAIKGIIKDKIEGFKPGASADISFDDPFNACAEIGLGWKPTGHISASANAAAYGWWAVCNGLGQFD